MSRPLPLTLNQLRAFERVLRLGSFRAAADELGLTQPSVSQRIRELESALDRSLFVRQGPRASPTGEAQALLAYADRMLSVQAEIDARFGRGPAVRGTLRVGLSENFAMVGLTELLRRLEQRHPSIEASLFIGDSGQLSRALNRREVDVAIVAEPQVDVQVEQLPVGWSRLAWFAGPRVVLPRRAMDPAELARHPLIVGPPTSRLHATVMRWFTEAGVSPARVSTCNNVAVTRLAIRDGVGLGVVPARVMEEDLAAGLVQAVPVQPALRRHRIALCHARGDDSPALHSFIVLARQLIAETRAFEEEPELPTRARRRVRAGAGAARA